MDSMEVQLLGIEMYEWRKFHHIWYLETLSFKTTLCEIPVLPSNLQHLITNNIVEIHNEHFIVRPGYVLANYWSTHTNL